MAKKRTTGKVIPDNLAPFIRELTLAYERINGNSMNRLRWLLSFAERDLSNASSGSLVNIGWEVAAFAINAKPDSVPHEFPKYVDLGLLMAPWGPPEVQRRLDAKEPGNQENVSPSLVLHFQRRMKDIFEKLYSGQRWEYKYPPIVKQIAIPHIRDSKGELRTDTAEAMPAHELLELRAFELIEAEKDRLMICANPKCKRRFVATKKGRAVFHSPTCSAYVRIAKSRGKKI